MRLPSRAFGEIRLSERFLGGEVSFDEALRRVHARIAAGDLLAVRLAGDARIIGAISVGETDDGRWELAYLFAADKWGQGYATESICSLIHALRAKRDGMRLFATTQTANLVSRKLLARLGFSESRQFVEFGEMQVTFDLTL